MRTRPSGTAAAPLTALVPPSNPAARQSHGLSYDSSRDWVVMFGGFSGGAQQDTWEWDGATTWLNLTPRHPCNFKPL